MANVRQVADGIHRIQVQVPKVPITFTIYFVDDRKGVVVDPSPAATIPWIREAMDQLGMQDLSYIIPTHVHMDHAGAVGRLAQLFPEAKVVVHPLGFKHVVDPERLIESTKKTYGANFEERFGPVLPVPESQVKVVQDGEILPIESRQLRIIHSPGHTADHIAIYDTKTEGLFCGEALGVRTKSAGSSPLPNASPPSFDLPSYLRSMEKLAEIKPRILFYAHDGVGREPEELIANAVSNTKLFGDMIGEMLERGDSPDAIDGSIKRYVTTRLGVNLQEVDVRMAVDGYIHYFKRKGTASDTRP